MKVWESTAPSNIALIKYMGKISEANLEATKANLPTNASLSFTLQKLLTKVRITEIPNGKGGQDRWQALNENAWEPIQISEKGKARFLKHLALMKQAFGVTNTSFLVESANNFPSDCGLASSASSFAALTKAAALALNEYNPQTWASDNSRLASLSRQGSGSSCRSFFAPWSEWKGAEAMSVELPFGDLVHQAVVVEENIKSVSSSEAHKRVTSSDLFFNRIERAENRLANLKVALKAKDWAASYQLCWQEFWDMHALFETSKPHFGYMNQKTLFVLQNAREIWEKESDGPIVTMDAGPNVHLLWRREQFERAKKFADVDMKNLRVISTY